MSDTGSVNSLHLALCSMGAEERCKFITEFRKVILEEFVPERTSIKWVSLTFASGYHLVALQLAPQRIGHDVRAPRDLESSRRSCFLYNPDAEDGDRLIPLFPEDYWFACVNERLGIRVDVGNVTEYLKYYVYVCSGDTIVCFTNMKEISWSGDCSGLEKERVRGAIGVDLVLVGDEISINPCLNKKLFLVNNIEMVVPFVFKGSVCSNRVKVSESGYVRFDVIKKIVSDNVCEERCGYPYYVFEGRQPSCGVEAAFFRNKINYIFGLFVSVLNLLAIVSQVIVVVGVYFSVKMGSPFEGMVIELLSVFCSELLNVEALFQVLFAGSILWLCACSVRSLRDAFVVYAAVHGPGKLASEWECRRTELRKSVPRRVFRLLGVFKLVFVGVFVLAATWAYIVFWLQYNERFLFDSDVLPSLEGSFHYAFFRLTLDPLPLWIDVNQFYIPPFTHPMTDGGRFVSWLIGFSGVLLLVKVAERFWLGTEKGGAEFDIGK